ncbi:MAG: signal peptide peptidase SppA [Pseudomonadota bacterium]
MAQGNFITRFFGGIWKLIDFGRRVAHLIFLALFFSIIGAVVLATGEGPLLSIKDRSTLVLAPEGMVVEQYTTDATQRALGQLMDEELPETRMRDLLAAIDEASRDSRIDRMLIRTDYLWGIGPSQLQELKSAIGQFKDSGKPVIAYGYGMSQQQYYLAALADQVWLHPEGLVLLEGYGVYRNYYKDGLDKLAVDVHLFRVGEYKSAAEPFIRNDMSDYSREANRYWLDSLWDQYLTEVAAQRDLTPEKLARHVDEFGEDLRKAGGRASEAALAAGLVDRVGTEDELREYLLSDGVFDADIESFRQIDAETYLAAQNSFALPQGDQVAVVVAQGAIVPGDQSQGTVGGESTARLIRRARMNDSTRALVLRVDSPGGAVLPSEQIRREIELTRASGIPVVVSMSSVAASGGYWISMSANEIWANPATITGSIGIFGLLTNFPRTLEKVGVYTDGVGTTRIAGALRSDRPMQPHIADIIQQIIEDGYERFIGKVATAREMTPEAVDQIARGRVWSGQQARDRGLVDKLGGLNDAIASAAEIADISSYKTVYVEQQVSALEQFLLDLTARLPSFSVSRDTTLGALLRAPLPTDLELLLAQPRGQQPVGVYAYCFCTL